MGCGILVASEGVSANLNTQLVYLHRKRAGRFTHFFPISPNVSSLPILLDLFVYEGSKQCTSHKKDDDEDKNDAWLPGCKIAASHKIMQG